MKNNSDNEPQVFQGLMIFSFPVVWTLNSRLKRKWIRSTNSGEEKTDSYKGACIPSFHKKTYMANFFVEKKIEKQINHKIG